MTMVSYAQNGEDVVLHRALGATRRGFYIDVGASDPMVDSVTKHFYDRGWHGINIEPAELAARELIRARPRDRTLAVGVGAQEGEMTFYELPRAMTGCSTVSGELAEEYQRAGWGIEQRTIEVLTLSAICERHVQSTPIDFLKVDVEGAEAEVLAGADFERFRPRVLVIEATAPGAPTPAHEAWEPTVLGAGYRLTLFDGLNRFYVREEDAELGAALQVPANVFDDYIPQRFLGWHDEAEAARTKVGALTQEIDRTREELTRSEARLRDARTELIAARSALQLAVNTGAGSPAA